MKAPVLLLLLGFSGAAGACGYHGALADGFSVLHPRSMAVAFALHDAIEEGLIEKAGVGGYAGAALRLHLLHRRLAGSGLPISVLLVDSGLWTQFDPLAIHASGPRPGDVVILTSEQVLAAVLDGRLPVAAALERGLIVVDGAPPLADTVRRYFSATLGES